MRRRHLVILRTVMAPVNSTDVTSRTSGTPRADRVCGSQRTPLLTASPSVAKHLDLTKNILDAALSPDCRQRICRIRLTFKFQVRR